MLGGSSAGAMVMGSVMRRPPLYDGGDGKDRWVDGLGIAPNICVLPHHERRDPAEVAAELRQSAPPEWFTWALTLAQALSAARTTGGCPGSAKSPCTGTATMWCTAPGSNCRLGFRGRPHPNPLPEGEGIFQLPAALPQFLPDLFRLDARCGHQHQGVIHQVGDFRGQGFPCRPWLRRGRFRPLPRLPSGRCGLRLPATA